MTDILITRKWRTLLSTCGILNITPLPPFEPLQLFTLEPVLPIPAGRYRANITQSPRLSLIEGRVVFTPRLYDVPGFPNNDVLIHFGNFPENTEGCTLVGMTHETNYVGESDEAFGKMMSLLYGDFFVTYVDAIES